MSLPGLVFWIARRRKALVRPNRAFGARFVVGRLAITINGFAPAAMSGILLTREASAQRAFTSGLKRNAFRAVDGRRIPSGMRIREKQEAVR